MDQVAVEILAAVCAAIGPERAVLIVERSAERRVAAALRDGACVAVDQPLDSDGLASILDTVIETETPIYRAGPDGHGSLACLPLGRAGPRAFIHLEHASAEYFDEARRTALELLAPVASLALVQAEACEQSRARERSVQWSESQLRAIIENARSSVFLKNLEGRYVLVNRQLELDTGLPREQMLGKSDFELFSRETAERIHADDRSVIESGQPLTVEGVTQFPSGPRTFLTTKVPLRDMDGNIYAICGLATDITERKRAEEQLHHVERMNALGQLAGGIAHDFNNMLAGILAAAELLDVNLPHERAPELAETITTILSTCERAADLTRKLLAFSRKAPRRTELVDVHELITSTVALLRHSIDRRITIELRLAAACAQVRGDPGLLQSALLNLAVNARDAMPDGGTLEFTTRDVELSPGECETSPFQLQPGAFVEVSVRDTGGGIADDLRLRIFEPFFTTKAVGSGTGLGLAAVHGTVDEHGGSITVDSTVGRGTTFVIRLRSVRSVAQQSEAMRAPVTPIGEGRILLVDDEDIVRRTGTLLLESLGYEVVTARNGREGVERFATEHEALALVLLDMIMPEMNGHDAFRAMQQIDAEVPVVVCSGYAADEIVRSLRDQGLAGFLPKPYRRAALAEVIGHARRGRYN
jgi:two-component system cell cycle sensor histidine kinase/response regulator CckA